MNGLDMSRHVEKLPADLQVPTESAASFVYDLYAVCNHYGNLHGGHYTG